VSIRDRLVLPPPPGGRKVDSAVCSPEVSEPTAQGRRVTATSRPLLESAARSESNAGRVFAYRFADPTSPLAISPALWFSAASTIGTDLTNPITPLVGFRVPPEYCSASPSRAPTQGERPSSSHELPFPSALPGTEDPLPRACLTRFGPPSGFGYPLDGFRPSEPGRPCFMPTALLGSLTPFEAFSSRKVPEAITPPGEPACR
jgi:hypothetical protein